MPLDDYDGGAVRRVRRVRLVRDEHGRLTRQVIVATEFVVDEDGCINQFEYEDQARFYSCGCHADQPPGGKCIGCDRVSCARCFLRCSDCRRPLCLACASNLFERGQEYTFCPRCVGPARRLLFADAILSALEEFDRG